MEPEGPARRQGRQPGRDDLGARAAGAARASPSPPTPAAPTWTAAGRTGSTRRSPSRSPASRRRWASKLGDPDDPLLVSVRSGAKFSMPGMMDTVLNLGLNDESVEGLAKQTGDERFAYDSYRRFIAMYGRIVLDVDGERVRRAVREGQGARPASPTDAEIPAEALRRAVRASTRTSSSASTGKPFPQDPADQLRGAIEAVFRSWNGARAIAYRVRERIPHDLGTAVNVQAMVFGNRDDNSGTGVGFTRNPATGENGAYGDFLVNAQGEDVVAGIRNTEAARRTCSDHFPTIYDELLGHLRPARGALPRHVRHRVHHRAGQALDAPDPGRQAHRRRRAADGRRHDQGPPTSSCTQEEAVQRVTAEHLDQVLHPQFAGERRSGHRQGPGRLAGRRRSGKAYFTADDAADAADRGEKVILVRSETSPEDVHGMIVAEGILTARGGLVSHAAVVARGWGKPAVVGAEAVKIERQAVHRRRRHRATRATSSRSTAPPARSSSARSTLTAAEPPRRVRHHPRLGRRDPQGQARPCGPTPTTAPTPPTPASSAPRASACAAPSTCSSARTACRRAAHDPGRHARGGGRRARGAARGPEGRLRRDPRGHGRPARHRAPARPAAARVPAPRRGAGDQGGHRRASPTRSASCSQAAKRVARVQPDARHPRRAPRRGQARPLRHAGAGADGGGRRAGGRRRQADRRDHDPAHRHPRGAGPGPRLGRGRDRRGHRGRRRRSRDVTHRHDDRDAPRRAAGRRDRRGGRLLLASAPTTSPR